MIRSLVILAGLLCLAACGRPHPEICRVTTAGTQLWIDTDAEAYGEVASLLRKERFDEVIKAARLAGQNVQEKDASDPRICVTTQNLPKSVDITYPSRRLGRDVGAVLELHLGEDGKVKVAEFYVVPLAP